MNNFTFGNAALPVLRDDLRRFGSRDPGPCRGRRVARRFRRHRCRTDAHDQLAPDRPRGAGIPLSGPPRELRDPAGFGRSRALARRQRWRAAHPLPGGDDRVDPLQQPCHRAVRTRRWRTRGAGAQLGRAEPMARARSCPISAASRWLRAISSRSKHPVGVDSVVPDRALGWPRGIRGGGRGTSSGTPQVALGREWRRNSRDPLALRFA